MSRDDHYGNTTDVEKWKKTRKEHSPETKELVKRYFDRRLRDEKHPQHESNHF